MKTKWGFDYWWKFFRDRFRRRYGWISRTSVARRLRKEIRYNREVGLKKQQEFSSAKGAADTLIRAVDMFDIALL